MTLRSLRATLVPVLLLAGTPPAPAQSPALHTVAPEGSRGYVVAVDSNGDVAGSPTALAIPSGTVTAQWQLGMKGDVRYLLGYRITDAHPNRFRFVSFVGTNPAQAAATPVTWGAGVDGALAGSTGGILSSTVGFPTAFTLGAVRTGDLRWVLVFGSGPTGGKVISVLELEGATDARTLRCDSFAALSPAQLPASSTWQMLGIGYNALPLPDGRSRLVTGDSTRTWVLAYDGNLASGNRIAPASPASHANPAGFEFLTASAAAEAGKFWVAGVSSGQVQVRRFDVGTGYEAGIVWSRTLASGERAVPAFDPNDRSRLAVVLYRSGGTRVVRLDLSTGSVTGDQDSTANFSSAIDPAPVAIVSGGNGYLAGRAAGEARSALWKLDGTGLLTKTSVEFDVQPHATLLLEAPERPELSIVADSAGATDPGQKATFTVTRAVALAAALNVTYRVDSPDGTAAEGVDWDRPSGVLALGAGVTTGKIEVQTRSIAGCKQTRTFRVVLTNTDATLKVPDARQTIAASTSCQLSIAGPPAAVAPGGDLTFTISRTGDVSGPYPASFTTAPGSGTSASDFVPPASPVTLGTGQASAALVVRAAPTTETCRPERTFTVTLTSPSAGGTTTATGRIAAVTTTCAATARVTSPAEPYLPGDEMLLQVDTSAAPGLNPAGTVWEVVESDSTWEYRWPSAAGTVGQTVKLQFTRVPEGGGSRTVRYTVPYTAGTPAPSVGTLQLKIADFRQLVRLDGPTQVVQEDSRDRRFRVKWLGGSAREGDWYGAPRQIVWRTRTASGTESTACSGGLACTTKPPAGVTKLRVEATLSGVSAPILVQELDVTEVPAPSSSSGATVVRYVPVALESRGAGGTDWETELTLLNRGAGTSAVDLEFRGKTQREYVGAHRQMVINGLVERMREADASISSNAAPVKVTFRNLAEGETAEVLARTTTPTGQDLVVKKRGRAGLAYPGLRDEELFGDPEGSPKRSGRATLIGLRGTTDQKSTSVDRTNLAIVNPNAATQVTVRTRFYPEGGGAAIFDETKTLGGDQDPFTQYSNLAGYTGLREVSYATVDWVSGGVFTAYSTPIDNASGDGSWVFPVTGDDTASTQALVLPVLLEVPGDAGRFRFLSDLTLAVPSGSLGVQVDYFWQGGGTPAMLVRTVSGQTVLGRSNQVGQAPAGVVKLFRETGSGSLPGGGTVIGLAMVSRSEGGSFPANQLLAGTKVDGPASGDPDGAQYGRFGIFLPALRVESLKGLSELTIAGLRNDADVRSNLALYNPAASPVNLNIDLFSSDAPGVRKSIHHAPCAVADGKLTLAARTYCQIGGVLSQAGESIRSGYAVISRTGTDTTQPFGAYGVINDNPTNDGAYLPPFLKACGLSITPGTLPQGLTGAAYSQQLGVVGGRAPFNFLRVSGSLPAGLDLSAAGLLSGTPTSVASVSFRVRATDAVGCAAEKDYSLTVLTCPAVSLSPASLAEARVGEDYQQSLSASGGVGPYTFRKSAGDLPPGLSLQENGVLQGRPTEAGTFTFTAEATDANGCKGELTYTITVSRGTK